MEAYIKGINALCKNFSFSATYAFVLCEWRHSNPLVFIHQRFSKGFSVRIVTVLFAFAIFYHERKLFYLSSASTKISNNLVFLTYFTDF